MADHLAALAAGAGVPGLVCSAREVQAIRARFPKLFLCTPGIRPQGASAQDQVRTQTPRAAVDRTYRCRRADGGEAVVNRFDLRLAMACGDDRYVQCEDGAWIRPSRLTILDGEPDDTQ